MKKIGILITHPIQYLSGFLKQLAKESDLKVYYCINPNKKQQYAEFGIEFSWDVPLLQGYNHEFLTNISGKSYIDTYFDCDTPEISLKIKDEKFDYFIIFGWYYKSAHQALAACNRYNVPVYVRGDSTLLSNRLVIRLLKKLYFKHFLNKFDGFLSPGKKFKEYLKFYGVPEDKIIFCPHFVDNEFFKANRLKNKDEVVALRNSLGISADELVFLFCGKLVKRKSPLDLLRALASLKGKNIPVKAIIAGEGVLRGNLERYSKERGLDVLFLGFKNQRELPAIYSVSDCLVLSSSELETWGLIVNEAFACGIPAIVSDRCGCAVDMIEEGVTGYTYRCGDTAGLAGKMMQFIEAKKRGFSFEPLLERKLQKYCAREAINSIKAIT